VRTFLGCEDEVAAIVLHHRGDGLAGEEIVAEIDGPQRCEPGVMLVEPALDGVSLAILFFRAVLRCDELRHQRDDFGMARRDDRRRQVIVGRNFLDAEQALAIRPALAFLQSALKGQERSALHEKHRERRQTKIRHGNIAAPPLTGIRKGGANHFQTRQKGCQQLHPYAESSFR
jgi:hypothetical protein